VSLRERVGSEDEEGMVNAMELLVTDKTLLEQYKKASLEIISDWSIEKAYKKMADHICSVAVGQKIHN